MGFVVYFNANNFIFELLPIEFTTYTRKHFRIINSCQELDIENVKYSYSGRKHSYR